MAIHKQNQFNKYFFSLALVCLLVINFFCLSVATAFAADTVKVTLPNIFFMTSGNVTTIATDVDFKNVVGEAKNSWAADAKPIQRKCELSGCFGNNTGITQTSTMFNQVRAYLAPGEYYVKGYDNGDEIVLHFTVPQNETSMTVKYTKINVYFNTGVLRASLEQNHLNPDDYDLGCKVTWRAVENNTGAILGQTEAKLDFGKQPYGSYSVTLLVSPPASGTDYYYADIEPVDSENFATSITSTQFSVDSSSGTSFLQERFQLLLARKQIFRVPSEYADLFHVYSKRTTHYVSFHEITPTKKVENGNYTDFVFNLPTDGSVHYTIQPDESKGNIKFSMLYEWHKNDKKDVIEVKGYSKNPEDYKTDESVVYKGDNWQHFALDNNFRIDNSYVEANLYLNVDDSNYLALGNDEVFELRAFRAWQAVVDVLGNYFVEPQFHYDDVGDQVVDITEPPESKEGNRWVTLQPNGNSGVSVIKVSYDAMFWAGGNLNDDNIKSTGIYYNAIDPVNTRVVIVEVGGKNTANIQANILDGDKGVGTEYDTIYYAATVNGEKTADCTDSASFTFKPTADSGHKLSVRVHDPLHNTEWKDESKWTSYEQAADGSFTVQLKDGRNIIEISADDGSRIFYVINCRAVNVNIKNISRPEAIDYQVGDSIELSFDGLTLPIQKMAAIYNPNFPAEGWVQFKQSGTGRIFRSDKGNQYAVIMPGIHKITLALNTAGDFILTEGHIRNVGLGSGLGAHRHIDKNGLEPNLNASAITGHSDLFSVLPDIKLTVLPNSEEQAKKFLLAQLAEWIVNGTYFGGNASDWAALDAIRNATQVQDYFNSYTNQQAETFDLEVSTSPVNYKDVTVALRYKEDGGEWQPLSEGVAVNGLSTKKAYMVEATVTPNNPEDGYTHTYTRHIITAQNVANESVYNALPTLSNLQLDSPLLTDKGVFNMDGLLMAADADGAALKDLGYGFLATRNDFVVDLPSTVTSLTLTANAVGEQKIRATDFAGLFLMDPVAPSVTVNGAAVDENGKVTVDLTKAEAIEQTVAAAKMTAKTEKAPAEAETPAYQFSGEDENGVMKYWNIGEDGNAVYVTMPDTAAEPVALAEELPVQIETKTLQTDTDNDGRVDTIYVIVTSNLEGKAAAAQTNTYTIHINYIETVKVTVANKLAGSNLIIYKGDEVLTPNNDGAYSLRYGEDYTYTYTAKGYQGLNKQPIELPNQAAWTLELPALSPVNQQTGEATVRIVGADSLLRATTTVQVDPFQAADLFSLGYVKENYNGYTVLHALVEAGTASGNSTIFTCENGIFRPKDTATSAGGWVCEVNHVVVPQAALQSTMLNAGDKVDFYWQPYEGGNHIWFADASGNALEETSITQGESATLKLQGHSGVDMNNLVVYVGSKLVTPTVSGNEITISAADLNSPQSYFVSATAGQSSLAIAQVTVNGKTTQNPGVSGKSVTFRLIGCSLTEDGQKIDFGEALLDYKGAEYQTWIPTTTFTFGLDETVTVGDVFKKALDGRGLGYVGFEKNYIESITAPSVLGGYELAEMTNGARSGWMYTVNGKHPNKGLNEWEVKNGDVIIWHYVNDYQYEVQDWSQNSGADPNYRPLGSSKTWNKWLEAKDIDPNPSMNRGAAGVSGEKTSIIAPEANINKDGVAVATVTYKDVADAVTKAKKDEAKSITIMPQNTGKAKSVAVNLQVDSAKEIAKAELGLNVNTTQGSLAIPDKALEAIAGQAGGVDIRINVESKDTKAEVVKAAVESALAQAAASLRGTAENLFANACVTEVTITSNNKEITSFGGHELTINLPVNSKNFEKDNNYKVVVISGDDTVESIIGKCLRVNGDLVVQVKVSHLSTFIVTTEKEKAETAKITMSFADINENQWFYEAVKFVYEAGLMNGDGENTFNPNGNLNRAMLVTILYRLEQTPEVTEAAKFSDVAAGQWYTKAVIWASSNGIVNGYEDGTFKPNNNVSREEMAAMLMRYAEFKKIDVSATKDISSYKDATNVAEWAKQNMSWANSAGLIQGDENNNLNPQGKATRAEAAMILMRLVKNVIR